MSYWMRLWGVLRGSEIEPWYRMCPACGAKTYEGHFFGRCGKCFLEMTCGGDEYRIPPVMDGEKVVKSHKWVHPLPGTLMVFGEMPV